MIHDNLQETTPMTMVFEDDNSQSCEKHAYQVLVGIGL
jgi:hypothetical protein